MSEIINQSLQKIAKGTGIVFIGSLIGVFLVFISKLMVARHWTESDYGIFSLALVVLNIGVIISTLGLQEGVTRSIAYARGKGDTERVQKLISASIQFGLLASIFLFIIMFFIADFLATKIFHTATLGFPLKLFALGVPFFTMINVLVSFFRGFNDVKPKIYFHDIFINVLFPLFLLAVIFLKLSFISVFYAYLASLIISCFFLVIYAAKQLPSLLRSPAPMSFHAQSVARELLSFSIPLLGVTMLYMIIIWTDILMLGGYKSSVEVGLYNAANPLANFIALPLVAMQVIYTPVISELYGKKMFGEMRRNFSILTKWVCSATLPLFFILFLFPGTVVSILFGANYVPAANALRILSLGFIINNFMGPNGQTLIAMGESRFLMLATFATAVLNIGLNASLIPPLGIEGAAIASAVAITSINLIRCWKLYSLRNATPLSKNLIKPTLASLAPILLLYFIYRTFIIINLWMLLLLFILYYVVYGSSILLTKSLDREDIELLISIENRTGVNIDPIKRFLKRFL